MLTRWRGVITVLFVAAALFYASSSMALQVGDKAPGFALPATTAEKIELADYLGKKPVVVFFFIGAFTKTWTQEALTFQLDLPKFEGLNAQVLGVSVDFNDANKAFAEKIGLTYPLLSDFRREMSRAYGVLYDDPAMATDAKKIPLYLRSQRAWFVIDKTGVIRYTKINDPRELVPNEEILQVLQGLQ